MEESSNGCVAVCVHIGAAMLPAEAAVQGEEIVYQLNGQNYTGYMAYDDALSGERPGLLVLHEWWGHNAYARHRADMLAGLGYTTFALDMYGSGQLADHPETATKFMQAAGVRYSLKSYPGTRHSSPIPKPMALPNASACRRAMIKLPMRIHGRG